MRPGEGRTAAKKPGTLICGKWKVDRVIKVTDQLATYEARDPKGAKVHLKVIHPYKADDAPLVARLKREAYVANRIKHPSMVRVLGDGMTDEGSLAIALELVDGETLEELRMKRGGMLPPDEVIKYGSALCDALQAAHDEQIVHRDVRPESFMVTKQGELRVPEFAAARVLGETVEAKERTAAGATLGSPAFMSPEQARGQRDRVDARSDVFGLGATLYTLVSGKTVHAADNPLAGLLSASRDRAKPVRTVMRSAIPDHLADAIDKALKFEPTDRFPSMRAFKRALTPKEEARPAAPIARTEASPVRPSQKPPPPLLGRPPTAQPFAPSPPAVPAAPQAHAHPAQPGPMARPSGMMAAPTQASPAVAPQGHPHAAQPGPMARPSGMMAAPFAPTQASPAMAPQGHAGPTRPSPSMPPPAAQPPQAAPEAPARQKPQRPDIALVRQEVDEESTAVMDQPPPGMSASGSTPPPAPQGYGGHGHAQGYAGHGSMPPPAMGMGHPSPGMGAQGMGMGQPSGSVPPPAHPGAGQGMGMAQPPYGAPAAAMPSGYPGQGPGSPGHAPGPFGQGPGSPGYAPGPFGQGAGSPGYAPGYAAPGYGGSAQGMGPSGPPGGAPGAYAGQGLGGPGPATSGPGPQWGGAGGSGPYPGQGMGGPGGSGPYPGQGVGGPGQGMGGPGGSGPYPGQPYGAPGMGSGFPGPMPNAQGGPQGFPGPMPNAQGGPQGFSGPMGVMPGQAPASNRTFAYVAVGMGGTLIVLALVYAFFFMKPG
jgi:serine/threonine protein kinase